MKQYFPRLLTAVGLVAALALVGCGSEAGNGDTGTVDAGATDTGSGGGTDTTGGGSDTTTGGGSDAGATDTGSADPCDACTENQECKEGKCVDKKPPCGGKCPEGEICDLKADKCIKPSCTLPEEKTLTGNTNINKVISLQLLDEKKGCDLNDDASPDNVAGKIIGIYAAANDAIKDAVKDGSIVVLMAPDSWKTDKSEFTMDLLLGDIDPSTKDCDASAADKCKYTVNKSSYDQLFSGKGTCPALVTFDPTKVDGDKMEAGGDKQVFNLSLPVVGIQLVLKISKAQINGTVADKDGWKTTKDAMLCGVIGKDDLEKAIDAVPDDVLKQTGFDKATIKSLIGGVLKPDIDTDGDKEPDAISIALSMETAAATVTGYAKD